MGVTRVRHHLVTKPPPPLGALRVCLKVPPASVWLTEDFRFPALKSVMAFSQTPCFPWPTAAVPHRRESTVGLFLADTGLLWSTPGAQAPWEPGWSSLELQDSLGSFRQAFISSLLPLESGLYQMLVSLPASPGSLPISSHRHFP